MTPSITTSSGQPDDRNLTVAAYLSSITHPSSRCHCISNIYTMTSSGSLTLGIRWSWRVRSVAQSQYPPPPPPGHSVQLRSPASPHHRHPALPFIGQWISASAGQQISDTRCRGEDAAAAGPRPPRQVQPGRGVRGGRRQGGAARGARPLHAAAGGRGGAALRRGWVRGSHGRERGREMEPFLKCQTFQSRDFRVP